MATQAEELLESVCDPDSIPSIPMVALKIVRLAADPGASVDELAAVIDKDPALAAKTLRFANSSYYGTSKPIGSLPQALVRLGFRTARLLALSFGIVEATSRQCAGFDFPTYWHRSLTTSVVARRLARRSMPKLVDEVFVTALLSDIGCPVLARKFPVPYRSIVKLSETGAKRLCDAERSFLGIDHAQVGAALLAAWHLPDELVQSIKAHHDLTGLTRDSPAYAMAATVMAASEMSDLILGQPTLERIERLAGLLRELYSFTPGHLKSLLDELEPEVREVGQLMAVPTPPVPVILAEAKREALRMALTARNEGPAAMSPAAGPQA